MSHAHAVAGAPQRRRQETPASSPRLRLLKFELPKSKLPFSLLCIGILVATLVAVLLLNIFISNTSYEIERLGAEKE
ncbi:hypothetical protein DN545_40165, partial [Burkholderia multivorans]